jgi:hypothetical protein
LEQSAYKSSQAHINRLLNSSPELHGKYATAEERRNALAAKAADTDAAHAKLAYERKRAKRRRLSPPEDDEEEQRVRPVPATKYRKVVAVLPTDARQPGQGVKVVTVSSHNTLEPEEDDGVIISDLEEDGTPVENEEDEEGLEDEEHSLEHQSDLSGEAEQMNEEVEEADAEEEVEAEEEEEEEEEEEMEDEDNGREVYGDDRNDKPSRQSAHNKKHAPRADLVNDWLDHGTSVFTHVVPVLESGPLCDDLNDSRGFGRDTTLSSTAAPGSKSEGKTKKAAPRISNSAESAVHRERVPLRPVINHRSTSDTSSGGRAADAASNGKVKVTGTKKGPFSSDEIESIEEAFKQACQSLNFSREQMQEEIAHWGRTDSDASYKTIIREAVPSRSLRSLREFCQRHFDVSRVQKGDLESTKAARKSFDSNQAAAKRIDSTDAATKSVDSIEAVTKSSGPFSASEKETVERILIETLQAQGLSRAEFFKDGCVWKGPVVKALSAALAAALPQRSARSLREHVKRNSYDVRKAPRDNGTTNRAAHALATRRQSSTSAVGAPVFIAEQNSDSEVESESHSNGKQLLAVVIPVEETSTDGTRNHVGRESARSNGATFAGHAEDQMANEVQDSEDFPMSNDDLPAEKDSVNVKQHKRSILQQPTPVTSSANVSGPESETRPKKPRDDDRLPGAPQFVAQDHLNIFDVGDYHDILKENVVVLSRNAAIGNLVEDNTNLGVGNEKFWQAISDAMLWSKFISIGNPAGITQLRRLAYRTMMETFELSPAAIALQRDEQCHPLQKMEALVNFILNGAPKSAKLLPRMWRADLIDCTREEIAWIQYSEELEKAKLCSKAHGDHDQIISTLGRKARKRLRRAWSRVQTEMEKARELAGEAQAKNIEAAAAVTSNLPTQVELILPNSQSSLGDREAFTSDVDDGPVHFKAPGAIPSWSFSMDDRRLDDDIDVIPAGTRHAIGTSIETSSQRTQPSVAKTHLPQNGGYQPGTHQGQTFRKEIIIPNSQPDDSENVTATRSKKRSRESPASGTSPDHLPMNTAAAKLQARQIGKKAKTQTTETLPSPYLHPIPAKAVKQNISKVKAAQRRAYGDMSRETFLAKCRAGGS